MSESVFLAAALASYIVAIVFIIRPDSRNPRALPAGAYPVVRKKDGLPSKRTNRWPIVSVSLSTDLVATTMAYARYYVMDVSAQVPAELVFASDFGTATGTSTTALLDTDKSIPWTGPVGTGSPDHLEVVSGSGLDWPSTNALLTRCDGVGTGQMSLRVANAWAIPGVGESIYWRGYFRATSFTQFIRVHPYHTETPNTGAVWRWVLVANGEGVGTTELVMRFAPNASSGATSPGYDSPVLARNVTYRWEVRLTMATSTTGVYDVQIYSRAASGTETLLYETDSFANVNPPHVLMSDAGALTISPTGDLDGLAVGINGWDTAGAYDAFYQGAYAVSRENWCGIYNSSEATF